MTRPRPRVGTFDELVAEALAAPIRGWDFSWLNLRATEERPSWYYMDLVRSHMPSASSMLDVQVGGGEWLSILRPSVPFVVATEAWPPNVFLAKKRLSPLGIAVVGSEAPLPFANGSFDFVISRHPVSTPWREIARVLTPGGKFLSQQVGPHSVGELTEALMGPQPSVSSREPDVARSEARAAGLEVEDLRSERLRVEFRDIGAIVYFLRMVVWIVPNFGVDLYRDRLLAIHEQIGRDGSFVAHSARFLIEVRKPFD